MAALSTIEQKRILLEGILRKMDSVLVAYSGGVDSSFLLHAATGVLGPKNVLAATARSPIYIEQDEEPLRFLPHNLGVRHIFLRAEQMQDGEFVHNSQDRCFYCKRGVLGTLAVLARSEGMHWVIEGSNRDDLGDYRPGIKAVKELNARSPLQEAGLTKAMIRELARRAGLANWDKPSESCLATRFPYGAEITMEALEKVRAAEAAVKIMGFRNVRVRDYGKMARIEVEPEEVARLASPEIAAKVVEGLRAAGYQYISMDLQGYRRGSLNETLNLPPSGGKNG